MSYTSAYTGNQIDNSIGMGKYGLYYDDLRVPLTAVKLGGVNDPNFIQFKDNGSGSTGVFAYAFDKYSEEEVFFSAQLPHSYKEGTDIIAHVHWAPSDTDTGVVVWGLEYTWVNVNGTFSNSSIEIALDAGDGTAKKHQKVNIATISGASKEISSMLICRVFRDATNGFDDYDADAFLLEIDFHYQIDSFGSDQITSKT